jgi:hypothetical protein
MHLPIASANNGGTALPICFATSFFGPRIFSSALYFLRDLRLMSRMIFSDDDRPAGLRLISTPQVRMIKNTLLNQNYIESPRVYRRLHFLRGWSYEQVNEIFTRSSRAGCTAGV